MKEISLDAIALAVIEDCGKKYLIVQGRQDGSLVKVRIRIGADQESLVERVAAPCA